MLVHEDVAALAERDAARLQKARVGTHAYGENDEVRRYLAPARKAHEDALSVFLELLHAIAEDESDAVLVHLFFHNLRHVRIKRREHMRRRLDERDGKPARTKILRHLDADEAAAHDDGTPRRRILIRQTAQSFGIGHTPKRKDARAFDARNRRAQGLRTGRQEKRVVRLFIRLARHRPHMDAAIFCIDPHDLASRAHVNGEALAKQLRRHEQEPLALLDLIAHIVWQAAVREGDVLATLKEHDLRILVQAPEPRRRRRPARHAADDHIALCLFLFLFLFHFHTDMPPSVPPRFARRKSEISPYRDNPSPCRKALRAAVPLPGS